MPNMKQRISTITIKGAPLTTEQLPKLDKWLRTLLWCFKVPGAAGDDDDEVPDDDPKFEIYRVKARLPMTNGKVKVVQGVRDVFEIRDSTVDAEEEKGADETKLVIIGRDLGPLDLEKSYCSFVES